MIVLTGADGFIGNTVLQRLRQNEEKVEMVFKTSRTELYEEKLECIQWEHVDTVIHAGAIASNQYQDINIWYWNLISTQKIIEKAEPGTHFIFLSSMAVANPITPYAWTKKFSEICLREQEMTRKSLTVTIFRLFNVYGASEWRKDPTYRSLPYRLADEELKTLWDDTYRDYVHVEDVVDAIMLSMADPRRGIFEVGTGVQTSGVELAKRTDWNNYKIEPRPETIVSGWAAQADQFLPGWEPKRTLIEEFPKIIEYLRHPFEKER